LPFRSAGFNLKLGGVLQPLTAQLLNRLPLAAAQVQTAVEGLVSATVPVEAKADFLLAFAQKGETVAEIAAFATALREKSVPPPLAAALRHREILDVVGTGGDQVGSFNISTTVAILCAAAGVAVAKHGNRAVTSQVGSADVLETLGIPVDLPPAAAAEALLRHNFAFFFAPNYHPAFKHIGPARQLCAQRGQRTIFNILGPLLNPARPSAQLIGVPRPELCEPLAHVLQSLGIRRGMVVCGAVGRPPTHRLDELSTLGDNVIAEFYQERGFSMSVLLAEQFPLQPATLADLRGGDRAANAEITRSILQGRERGPKRDAVILNAAAALLVADKVKSLAAGWDLAAETIDQGAAAAKLTELCQPK